MKARISIVSSKRVIKTWTAKEVTEEYVKDAAYWMWKAYEYAKLDFAVIVASLNDDGTEECVVTYGLTTKHADVYCEKVKYA